jgi:NAD(P)-dependent dehydrogenase (short-subunit alcohol dehydrogenase family)
VAGYDTFQPVRPSNVYSLGGSELISRFAEPKEIGDLAVLMCSERNTPWMTGSDVVIDGGKFPAFIMGKS